MRFNVLNRKIHNWGSIIIALPLLAIIGSGLLLQLKKQLTWVQPAEFRGSSETPAIGLEHILDSVRSAPGQQVSGWNDINRIDFRPGKGVAKVWLQNGWEVQVDLGNGDILHSAYRRSDLIEAIHDGSFFGGDIAKLGVFLPVAITLLVLWMTGVWLFLIPYVARFKRARAARQPAG